MRTLPLKLTVMMREDRRYHRPGGNAQAATPMV